MALPRLRRGLLSLTTAAALAATVVSTAAPASAATRDPVIIVAGTGGPAFYYEALKARLEASGYRTWIFQLSNLGLTDIRDTARDFARFADAVRAQTGAAKVDLIGHSQGGLVSRQYIRFEGGDRTVDSAIMFGSPNHGSLAANLARLFTAGTCLGLTACEQMTVGSSFLATLNAGDDTVGPVEYSSFYTVFDEIVVPYTSAIMADGATNVKIQAQCPLRYVEHIAGIHDGTVFSGFLDALAHRAITLNCFAL